MRVNSCYLRFVRKRKTQRVRRDISVSYLSTGVTGGVLILDSANDNDLEHEKSRRLLDVKTDALCCCQAA